jgi:hypothetical protein
MLAKGFILGRDALDKAKALDEKHQLTSTATARVSSFDKRIGLSVILKLYTKCNEESSSFCVFHLHHKKSTYVIESD